MMRRVVFLGLWLAITSGVRANETLFVATPVTEPSEFTEGIEGPACDAAGNIFVVNFARRQTIGRVSPDGKGGGLRQLAGHEYRQWDPVQPGWRDVHRRLREP